MWPLSSAKRAHTRSFAGYNDCFTYDAFGNRTVEAYSPTGCGNSPSPTTWANYNSSNQITGTNLMPAGYVYDAAGNVANDGANQYLYDNEERICAVKNLRDDHSISGSLS